MTRSQTAVRHCRRRPARPSRSPGLPPILACALLVAAASAAEAQWSNRYPRVAGYSHHVYVEGYELPLATNGPSDPAPAPDGRSLAFSSRGWIWLLELETGTATRVTSGAGMDSRPSWSPDGRLLAFVRDDTRATRIVLRDIATGEERVVVDDPVLNLDPAFSVDGRHLFFTSASDRGLDLWREDLESGARVRLTDVGGLALKAHPHPDGTRLLYIAKARAGGNEIRLAPSSPGATLGEAGDPRVLVRGSILSQTRPALAPDGRTFAYAWPTDGGWQLRLADVDGPHAPVVLHESATVPVSPAWSPDGGAIWFSEADAEGRMVLRRIAAAGGPAETVTVRGWEWSAETARILVRTRLLGVSGDVAARLHVADGSGHPAFPEAGHVRLEGQTGRLFFYSPGVTELTVPAGEVRIEAVHGLLTPPAVTTVRVAPRERREVELELRPVWDPSAEGWYSGDHHFHLNYGGPYRLAPGDLVLQMEGEALDVATPLLANLHNRFEDQHLWGWRRDAPPLVEFAQEVRSHFLGHLGLVGIRTLFWPWIWGPGYEVYGRDDRPNVEPLRHARAQGGVGSYVHPVGSRTPFEEGGLGSIPVGLVPDGVLGDLDAIELACLWSDELGTAEVWYRLLNVGRPVAPTAGTDVMTDFFRTMAVGTTRVYVRTEGPLELRGYLDGLRRGRSFVTTGPMLDFRVEGARPGGTVPAGPREAAWTLELHSAVPVERVELLVNGRVVSGETGPAEPGSRAYSGRVDLPSGGWVAARAVGGETTAWPGMNRYAFAHTSPVWIERVGSVEPAASAAAARDLLRALDVAETRLESGYAGVEIPRLEARFQEARRWLEERAAPVPGSGPQPREAPAAPPQQTPATAALHRLFDDYWEHTLRESPLFASQVGDRRYEHLLPRVTEADHRRRLDTLRAHLARLEAIDREALEPDDRVNRDVFGRLVRDAVAELELRAYLMPFTTFVPFYGSFPEISDRMDLSTVRGYESYLARLEAFPTMIDEYIGLMRTGLRDGVTIPRVVLEGIDRDLAAQVVEDPTESRLYEPFREMPAGIPEAERERLREAGRRAVEGSVVPGYRAFLEFMTGEYLPRTRTSIAASDLPDGRRFYEHRVRQFTTLDVTPDEVHERGLAEVARIRGEMQAILERVAFRGSFQDFLQHLRTDPRFYAETPEELVRRYAWAAKRMDGELPRLFRTLPRMPYGIRPIPDYMAPKMTTAYYSGPSGDGTRAGFYYVNTYDLPSRPLYEVEALTFHEAVPGHHLQIALAQEQGEVPAFRRYQGFTAFTEGWALYAERLGLEVGFYEDPYSDFGRLGYEMWRALRLVVDTGIHWKGWSRQQAIDFMAEHSSLALHNITSEVDRYISWPGQALGYKMGELFIRDLRARAERELGARFDLRAFHDAVLLGGALPLDVLEARVTAWMEGERATP